MKCSYVFVNCFHVCCKSKNKKDIPQEEKESSDNLLVIDKEEQEKLAQKKQIQKEKSEQEKSEEKPSEEVVARRVLRMADYVKNKNTQSGISL